jgi:hypothetical protein
MVFDAICFLGNNKNYEYWRPEQKAFKEKIDILTSGKLNNGYISMWGLCNHFTSFYKNDKFKSYTLDDLTNYFLNSDIKKELDNIWISDDSSSEEYVEKYLNYISILKQINFDKLWESNLLPIIQETINKLQKMYKTYSFDNVFSDIQRLKQCEILEDVKIYINVMSCPTTFKLYGNSFLDHIGNNSKTGDGYISNIYHELMHGFVNDEILWLYLEYINSTDYLREQHDILINKIGSGNEEEFVVAIEYYLRMKHNNENKFDLLNEARNKYNGCMPTSIFLFDLLSKEEETPDGYNKWLMDVFKNKRLPQNAIEYNLEHIM